MIHIRESKVDELQSILDVELDAFNNNPSIRTLVMDLFSDESARPLISLLAFDDEIPVGHVYFSTVVIEHANRDSCAMLLAPLAVKKMYHKKGIGQQLISAAIEAAKSKGVEAVFVLGHPSYYPKCGFAPAGIKGFDAPYPIPEKDAAAWMVIELKCSVLTSLGQGKVKCANSLMRPEYWRE